MAPSKRKTGGGRVTPKGTLPEDRYVSTNSSDKHHGDHHDVFVAGDGEMLSTELCETNFHFNWARLEKGSSKADEYVLINGNRFTIDGDGVFEGDEIHHSATIRRLGSELYISSDGERGIVSP